MEAFQYRAGQLFVEDVPLAEVAREFGTPCYVYSRQTLENAWRAFDQAFSGSPHLICYAVKANSNIAVLNLLARLGSGFDIVSQGELERVLRAGGDPAKVVFAGVGKHAEEMRRALEARIRCFNVESEAELELLDRVAAGLGVQAPVALRVNPDVDALTHPYISTGLQQNKFGIPMEEALALYAKAAAMKYIEVRGVGCHIGSQLTTLKPVVASLKRLLVLVDKLESQGIGIQHVDVGGGLGIRYRDEKPPTPQEYALAVKDIAGRRPYELIVEPGRSIAGHAGMLLTQVEYLKHNGARKFAIVDAAMNDLLRPALYDAWQEISPVIQREGTSQPYDVVGPVCESGDFLGKDRLLTIAAGDLLAVRTAGAYGFSMSSNYNTRPRAAEVMVDGNRSYLIRRRETIEELLVSESILPA